MVPLPLLHRCPRSRIEARPPLRVPLQRADADIMCVLARLRLVERVRGAERALARQPEVRVRAGPRPVRRRPAADEPACTRLSRREPERAVRRAPARDARLEAEGREARAVGRLVCEGRRVLRLVAQPEAPHERGRDDGDVRDGEGHAVLDEGGDDDFDAAARDDVGSVHEGDDGRDDYRAKNGEVTTYDIGSQDAY